MATPTTDEKAAVAAAEVAKAKKFERSIKSMKKAVLEVQLILLDGVDTDEQLRAAGRILAQSEYGDVVEERYIAKVCGYARCRNALSTENTRKGRFRISLSAKKVYDLEESRHFCSPDCLIASKDFGNKLPLRQDVVESSESLIEILALVRGSQYTVRSKPVRLKDENVLKPPVRPKNVKREKTQPKETKNAYPASSVITRSLVEDRGRLEAAVLSSQSSTVPTESILENDYLEGVSTSSPLFNTKGSLIRLQAEESNSTVKNPNSRSSYQSNLVISLTSGSDGKAAGTATESSSSGEKLQPDKDSLISTPIHSTVQTEFERLTIQERVGDQTVLPMFDYGGPSDAIEGYVPLKSRRDALPQAEPRTQSKSTNSSEVALKSGQKQDRRSKISAKNKSSGKGAVIVLKEEVLKPERPTRSQQDAARIFKEWEGLVTGSAQVGRAKMCISEVDGETRFSGSAAEFNAEDSAPSTSSSRKSKDVQGKPANLKPALKKQSKVKQNVRSVAWADQNMTNVRSHIGNAKSKNRASSINADNKHDFEKPSEDLIRVEDKAESMNLGKEERPKARLSESSLDSAMAARLASAEAIVNALTEAATSAANGELDGSEAVAQAGISILSASHNADTAISVSPYEVQFQSSAIDEDQLFARAAQAREDMRRLKMPRKYSKLQDEKDGYDDGDLIDNFNPGANEDDDDSNNDDNAADDADVEVDDDDDDYADDSRGFEGAHEVGFTAPPKGFKAEVSMFGTMFMALENWISAAAVAHIYGKEPQEEDEYLSVNGREYSPQAVIGDNVSAEILRTFSLCVSRALPEVVRALRISVPLSTLELSLGRLIKAMSFLEALPPFGTKQWRMLAILLLDALSIQRVPRLGVHVSNNRSMMRKVLDSTGTSESEYNVFRDVVLPLGRSPTFSTLSGG